MASKRMVEAVLTVLAMCQRLGLPFQKIDLEDMEAVCMYAEILADAGVTPEMLLKRVKDIGALEEFPTPHAIIKLLADDLEDDEVMDTVQKKLPNGDTIVGLRDPSKPYISRKALEERMRAEAEQKALEPQPIGLSPELEARRAERRREADGE